MNVRRYFAQTAREALRQLKEELGVDAIVLSNRAMDGGVEILALPADAVGALQRPSEPRRAAPARAVEPQPVTERPAEPARSQAAGYDAEEDFRVSLSRAAARQGYTAPREAVVRPKPFSPPRIEMSNPPPRRVDHALFTATAEAAERVPERVERAQRPPEPPAAPRRNVEDEARIRALQETNEKLMSEMSGIRSMLERQLAGFAWGESSRTAPARTRLIAELLETGFSSQLSRRIADEVAADTPVEETRTLAKSLINRQLRALASDADIIDRGGVYALVGPTGVGKTTTTAKLAARCVVRHGADKLALITTDGYRIGAHEQLRIYGRILGVPVFVVRDAADLRQTLAELSGRHMVLIDTVGMGQRDRMVAEQAAMLLGAGAVRRLLLLNATSRGDTLDDVVRAYDGPELAGCIFTKVDEAVSLAPAMDVAIRHQLELFYVGNGQRVPEDLHLPNRAYLLHRALKELPADSPWRLGAEEAGLLMAAGAGI